MSVRSSGIHFCYPAVMHVHHFANWQVDGIRHIIGSNNLILSKPLAFAISNLLFLEHSKAREQGARCFVL